MKVQNTNLAELLKLGERAGGENKVGQVEEQEENNYVRFCVNQHQFLQNIGLENAPSIFVTDFGKVAGCCDCDCGCDANCDGVGCDSNCDDLNPCDGVKP